MYAQYRRGSGLSLHSLTRTIGVRTNGISEYSRTMGTLLSNMYWKADLVRDRSDDLISSCEPHGNGPTQPKKKFLRTADPDQPAWQP